MVSALGTFFIIYFTVPIGLVLIYCLTRVKVVEQGTSMIVERWGRFHRRCDAGLVFLVPFMDSIRRITWRETEVHLQRARLSGGRAKEKITIRQTEVTRIDLRENVMDFPSQNIITRDNVSIEVHPMLVYRLTDPVRVAYETFDLAHATEKLVQTTLRSLVGSMSLDDLLASREEIERGLQQQIRRICHDWGLELKSVELLEINPTTEVQTVMHKQISAERIRRAAIVTSDGLREKLKLEAEGNMQAAIAVATGEEKAMVVHAKGTADARLIVAKAEAEAIRILASSLKDLSVDPSQFLVGVKYLECFKHIAAHAAKRVVYMPVSTDVVGAAGK